MGWWACTRLGPRTEEINKGQDFPVVRYQKDKHPTCDVLTINHDAEGKTSSIFILLLHC